MCLHTILRGREKKEALAKLEDTITVWKTVNMPYAHALIHEIPGGWTTGCRRWPIHAGVVTFIQNTIQAAKVVGTHGPKIQEGPQKYRGGGHFWLTEAGALAWGTCYTQQLVRCTVKKTDINTIGSLHGFPVVVVKKATFPQYLGNRKGGN